MSGATPEHGKLSRYKTHGCRCTDCRAANARAARDRRRQMAYGNPPRVDAILARFTITPKEDR